MTAGLQLKSRILPEQYNQIYFLFLNHTIDLFERLALKNMTQNHK